MNWSQKKKQNNKFVYLFEWLSHILVCMRSCAVYEKSYGILKERMKFIL